MTPGLTSDDPTVLERAVDLASVEGLAGLSIARLTEDPAFAEDDGIAAGFASDEQLQLAVWETAIRLFIARVMGPAMEAPEGRPRLEALCESYLTFIAADLLPGGCFMATVSAEFDHRPGPVRDAVLQGIRAWLGALVSTAETAGADDPEQVAFEIHSIGQGANQNYQLFRDEATFHRARQAFDRTLGRALPACGQ